MTDENVEARQNDCACSETDRACTRSAGILPAISRPITETQNRRQDVATKRLSNRDTQTIKNRCNSNKTIITGRF